MSPGGAMVLGLGLLIAGGVLLYANMLADEAGHGDLAVSLWLAGVVLIFAGWAEFALGTLVMLVRGG